MYYLNEKDLTEIIFPFVSNRFGRIEEVPDYKNNQEGMLKLLGILQMVQSDIYYPSLLEKASFLLVAINKDHLFENGNKRLALAVSAAFLVFNDKKLRDGNKEFYSSLLAKLFPELQTPLEDYRDFLPTDFATYNLSIVIADSGVLGIEYDDLKSRVLHFLEQSVEDSE